MLSKDEHSLLLKGVEQRARALQAFIRDHYNGEFRPRYIQNKVIPGKLAKSLTQRSCEGRMRKMFPQLLNNCWGFWYGPDIIRGSDGKFYVCEDNLGYVGGMGDLLCARDTLLRGFPELRRAIDNSNPESFYRNIADDYKSKLGPNE